MLDSGCSREGKLFMMMLAAAFECLQKKLALRYNAKLYKLAFWGTFCLWYLSELYLHNFFKKFVRQSLDIILGAL